jgi:hypothetical protein
MATQTIRLTPHTDPTPAVVEVERELSGAQWCARFPGSKDVSKLRPSFQLPVSDFISAIESAGGSVKVNATYRPPERAYLMEWCWMVFRGRVEPGNVPSRDGVNINRVHLTKERSIAAATSMSRAYDMDRLHTKPAGDKSLHCIGEAVDMNIGWKGVLAIQDSAGDTVEISSTPRDGMNQELAEVGLTYGVVKFRGGAADRPHWSTNGK